ncbi:hypothetical protein Trydic_g3526 [Trypoxylus dichotomus]
MASNIVVVNVDPGIDDAYALIMLVSAHNAKLITLAAIVCSFGNTILLNSCRNTIRLMMVLGRPDIPVYQGVNKSLIADLHFDNYFGADGFGDAQSLPDPDMDLLKTENAAEVLYGLANSFPYQVTLINLGPLTYPATALVQHDDIPLKSIWIMGGNTTASEEPEFNWRMDPEAAHSVLKHTKAPLYILGFDACTVVSTTTEWRTNILGAINNYLMEFMNAAEEYALKSNTTEAWQMCDAVAVAALLYEQVNSTKSIHCGTVTLKRLDKEIECSTRNGESVDYLMMINPFTTAHTSPESRKAAVRDKIKIY